MDVREAYEEFLHAKLPTSPQTVRGYKFRLAVFASWCEAHGYTLEQLTAKHIRQFVEDVSKRHGGPARSTIRQYALNRKTFLRWWAPDEDVADLVSQTV